MLLAQFELQAFRCNRILGDEITEVNSEWFCSICIIDLCALVGCKYVEPSLPVEFKSTTSVTLLC